MDFGLERVHQLLGFLGNPHEKLPIIHVAGTNGKGSVCAYMTNVLLQAGYNVGRFNSPHLIAPRDSVQINGQAVDENTFRQASDMVATINTDNQVGATSFELLVGTALWLFDNHQQGVLDFVVIEVGLGGLLDATNVVTSPVMTVITSIGLDHMGVLGNTIEDIALAKAGIMKKGCPVVIAPQKEPMAEKVLVNHARTLDISCVVMEPASIMKYGQDTMTGQRMQLHTKPVDVTKGTSLPTMDVDYTVSLNGDYQRENSATAVMALEWMNSLGHISLTNKALQDGMASTTWPGRLDWVDAERLSIADGLTFSRILVDGAHNSPACLELRHFVDQVLQQTNGKRIIWIIGVTLGKSLNDMLQTLIRPDDVIFTVPFSQPQGMPWIQCVDPVTLAQQADYAVNQKEALPQTTLPDALVAASSLYRPETDMVALCGSLYLVADLYRLIHV